LWKPFSREKTNLVHKCKHKHFIHILSTNYMCGWFLTINKPISSRNFFFCISSLWKGSLATKKITIALLDGFLFFLQVISPFFLSMDCLFPLQTILQ
jgi:hypothetical protein